MAEWTIQRSVSSDLLIFHDDNETAAVINAAMQLRTYIQLPSEGWNDSGCQNEKPIMYKSGMK